MNALTWFLDLVKPYMSGLALLVTWIGIAYVALRRRVHWYNKRFVTQVNFSLNYVVGDQLLMRTLLETTAGRVWPNEHGVNMVLAAAARTTGANPIVILNTAADHDFVNRAILNALSERFAESFVAASLGVPVRTSIFVFALTFEKYAIMRTRKLRIMLIEEKALLDLFGPAGTVACLGVNNKIYRDRLQTLRILYDVYVKDRTSSRPLLGRIELGVQAPAGDNRQPVEAPTFGNSAADLP